MTESRQEVSLLVGILDRSFEEDPIEFEERRWHALLSNLESVRPEDWDALPPGAERSIRQLVHHVGRCYVIYENHCFGDVTSTWQSAGVGLIVDGSPEQTIEWLRTTFRTFRNSVANLTDQHLHELTNGGWCDAVPRRDIVER
ncbi:MAG: DinB family protein, partial [Thermomicrobiales bacterium]